MEDRPLQPLKFTDGPSPEDHLPRTRRDGEQMTIERLEARTGLMRLRGPEALLTAPHPAPCGQEHRLAA